MATNDSAKITRSMAATALAMGITGLVCVGITVSVYSNDVAAKEQRISDLEQAVEVLEEANTTLKTESEVKQTLIDNLQWELENQPK